MSKQRQQANNEELARKLADTGSLTRAMQQAVRDAVMDHKQAGNSVAALRNGRVVLVQPEDIELPEGATVHEPERESSAA